MPLNIHSGKSLNSSQLNALRPVQNKPALRLLFVHGFLGSSQDWLSLVEYLPATWDLYALDLPGHGRASDMPIPSDFDGFVENICQQLQRLPDSQALENPVPDEQVPVFLVGYSLGARLLMHLALQIQQRNIAIAGFVLEGGNFGLQLGSEKQERWQNDCRWIDRFAQQALPDVLHDWYQQPVFSSLTSEQKSRLVEERSRNDGKALAKVMAVTSLAKQEYLLPELHSAGQSTQYKIYYVVGEHDAKFSHLYAQNKVPYEVISGAGHNTHKEQPHIYAQKLTQLLSIAQTN
ncbi:MULTISPECIES: 2-succinyl-6-hydroxy-2,4-cyclohexadiene-1-carboxylate synthase [Vibrio]|uniref:Putative 2-succinyl-6-hydroxy-2,4-cyclohexadiene-1-carboxylate synthase n=1 Tax=Vibrio halioticoli NBRC 102217 TaxID=1219072 RepID=V5FF66_9VIBR|nr:MULTISPECIES: 2-succinyl-6-hydroxy-2,4-cyclohexadiene-1-carboxylate synthase [Vibrio]MPW37132.1 2-succinyl-6-hydroxy-2,4-cyclohexadiene-1-carboxylate synthase [Vibrio sp. B1Z05]GAD88531.1 2-succinyl-6-hydroxy-2,4-cyclohexadiene-1-carboxylate synthase [Vibrio halioticoli NBRC 102217]